MDNNNYLETVTNNLKQAIEKINESLQFGEKEIAGMQDYYWQNYTEMDEYGYENYDNQRSLFLQENTNQQQRLLRSRYEKMLSSPYFGRVDFQFEDEDESESFYIGIGNFSIRNGLTPLVYDWRAPISSLFYDYDCGPASYEAPSGPINGTITAKGQYKIRNGVMIYGFDSDIKIDDEILAKELSGKGSVSLKNIIQTIQREQNVIIRNTQDKILVIQGVAGSGKTSVALHRIAYLLYHDREHLNSKNILILSPNGIFTDYISHILPELGEENIMEMSFDTFAYRELRQYVHDTQDRADLIEAMLMGDLDPHQYKYKQSPDFIGELDAYCIELEDYLLSTKNVKIKKWEKDAREIEELFYFKFTDFPLLSRMEVVADYVLDEYETLTGSSIPPEEKDELYMLFQSMFKMTDIYDIYNDFLTSHGYASLPDVPVKERILPYADVFPVLYLKYQLLTHREHKQIKHLVIDEMQDYTYVQYRILSKLFNCKMTIVGDRAQTLDDDPRDVSGFIRQCFGKDIRFLTLNKSYRNTVEIAQYAASLSSEEAPELFDRHGKAVETCCYNSMEELSQSLVTELMDYTLDAAETVAVITYTEHEAMYIYEQLSDSFTAMNKPAKELITLIDRSSSHFNTGITVIPYYLAKGLEFEEVLLVDITHSSIQTSEISFLYNQARYIAATRALHSLKILTCR